MLNKRKIATALSLAIASVSAASPAFAGDIEFNLTAAEQVIDSHWLQAGEGLVGVSASGEVIDLVQSTLPAKITQLVVNKNTEKAYVALGFGMGENAVDYAKGVTLNGCALYQVDLQTQGATCMAQGLLLKDLTSLGGDIKTAADHTIQFDAQGNVYFAGEAFELGATHQIYQYNPVSGALQTLGQFDNVVGFRVNSNGETHIETFDAQQGSQWHTFIEGREQDTTTPSVFTAFDTDASHEPDDSRVLLQGINVDLQSDLPKLKAGERLYLHQQDKQGDYIALVTLNNKHTQRIALPTANATLLDWSLQGQNIHMIYRDAQGVQQATLNTAAALADSIVAALPTPHVVDNH